ncbi:type IV secretory system conjugative DNA transfer family protein [Flexivirga caeni]|uniref:Type IV secretory system conjugative DNA transfer family protein n=1 Tax=Flexivirga caeni TaxID=2294115 RepID=A0A3M9LUV4_9MICO|nr:type IV secretion system DNA-binding domain-containing protein [Flexivirga caeni]RNI17022.1 type IV secretory system conjugative DNA transfer family protein [Flexivirga caeni]
MLEAIGRAGAIRWRVGATRASIGKIRQAIITHLPDTTVSTAGEGQTAFDDLSIAGYVRISRNRTLPLDERHTDDVARSVLAVFASTGKSELLRLQVILGARTSPRRAPEVDGAARALVNAKYGQHGFGCAIRVAAGALDEARARTLVADTAAAFRGLELPGVHVAVSRSGVRAVTGVRSPFLWPLWLSIDDLVSLLAWPIASEGTRDLPAVPPRHPKLLPAVSSHPKSGRPFGWSAASVRAGEHRLVAQSIADSLPHTHVLGVNGTGKSTAIGHMVLADVADGRGAVVIDPKGDLIDDLLARIPNNRLDDVVLLDARDTSPVGINPLIGTDPELAADSLLAVCHSLWADSWGPRTNDILHGTLLTGARAGDFSLPLVPMLLTNPGFRRRIIGAPSAADPLGLGSFWATFESWSDEQRSQAIQPLLNKLRQVMLRPALRGVFGQVHPKFHIGEVFTKQRILLVALGKGSIGAEAAQLLGSVVTTHLWHATTQRTLVPARDRQPVMIYIDEVQDYLRLPGDLGDSLAQARGLGVGFTLAHQELGQLGKLRGAVMANTRSKLIFQTAPDDARDLATAIGGGMLEREDFRALGAHQAYAQLLSKGSTTPWVSILTQPLPRPIRSPHVLRRRSADRYGQSLADTDEALLAHLEAHPNGSATTRNDDDLTRRRRKGGSR